MTDSKPDTKETIRRLLVRITDGHVGDNNRITRMDLRSELMRLLGAKLSDRTMRMRMEEVRNEPRGAWICGSMSSGYFKARDVEELEKYLAADRHRIARIAERIRNQERNAFRQEPGQKVRLKFPDQMALMQFTTEESPAYE